MKLENISDKEYEAYITMLKEKPIHSMDYAELTDLANDHFDKGNLKMAWRLLLLVLNIIWAKADTTNFVLKELLAGKDVKEIVARLNQREGKR